MTEPIERNPFICWQCSGRLEPGFVTIQFNGSSLKVHKTCKEDAENLLFKNKVTFQGREKEWV